MEPFLFDHPLIHHKISLLRDKKTALKEFRELVEEITLLMSYEVTRHFSLRPIELETPLGLTRGQILKKQVILIPVLRAGLGMVKGMLKLLPTAKVGHIGLYRDPEVLKPVEYYAKLPDNLEESSLIVLDPMLATGGSLVAVIDILKKKGALEISVVVLIAAPEGIKNLSQAHPDVPVFIGALDSHLNDHGYIVPGLGDAGDRLYGTL